MVRLRHLREEYGESQGQLADFLGVHASTISGWESGYRQMDYETLNKLSAHYNRSVDFIIGNDYDLKKMLTDEKNILIMYRNLSERGKIAILKLIEIVVELER